MNKKFLIMKFNCPDCKKEYSLCVDSKGKEYLTLDGIDYIEADVCCPNCRADISLITKGE